MDAATYPQFTCRDCTAPLGDRKAAKLHVIGEDGAHRVDVKVSEGSFQLLNEHMGE